MATIGEILDKLEKVELQDGSPNVEGPSLSVTIDTAYDFNYKDVKGYDVGIWGEEAQFLREIVCIVLLGIGLFRLSKKKCSMGIN